MVAGARGTVSAAELIAAAAAIRARAYVPYSGYAVGAAIRGAAGGIFAGCNVENAAYPQGLCAEANAVGVMVAGGERAIAELALIGSGDLLCTPCGGCRQRLAEFGRPDTPVHLADAAGLRQTTTLGALLPMAFGPINLGGGTAAPADAAAVIRAAAGEPPLVALVLGSGLGGIAERIADATVLDYRDLPGFPRPGVQGHAGRLHLGRLGGVPVACLQGRAHLYEGHGPAPLNTIVRTLKAVGCKALLLTNASGGLRPNLAPGSIVLVEDHINLQGTNPLVGANDEAVGPRFIDLTEVYSARLRAAFAAAAQALEEDRPYPWRNAGNPGAGAGDAWVHTARGRLRHALCVDDGRVAAWRIDAPTDRNFADEKGIVERLPARLPSLAAARRAVETAVLQLDPCVPYTVEIVDA